MKTLKKKLWRRVFACIAAALALPAGCENTQGETEDAAVIQEKPPLMARETVTGDTLNEAFDALFSGILTDMTDYRIDAATFAEAALAVPTILPIPKRALEIPASAWDAPEAEKPTGVPADTPASTPAGTPADTPAADKTQARVRQIGVTIWNSGGRVITITLAKAGDTYTDAEKGSLFTVGEGVIFTLDGVTLDGLTETADGTDNNAALVTVNSGGVLRMAGQARITGNTNKQTQMRVLAQGGGVMLAGATLVMGDDAKIDRNTVSAYGQYAGAQGGGIYANGGSLLEMSGGAKVTLCQARPFGAGLTASGGGIYSLSSTLNIKDNARVSENLAGIEGGGVYGAAQGGGIVTGTQANAALSPSLSITGNAKIENNRAIAGTGAALGGGIFAGDFSYTTIKESAAILNNTALGGSGETASGGAEGGGIYAQNCRCDMAGGRIAGNLAQGGSRTGAYDSYANIYGRGGGICAASADTSTFTLNIQGGEISGNTAAAGTITAEIASPNRVSTGNSDSSGGGIWSGVPIHFSGGVIRDNTAGGAGSPGNAIGGAVFVKYAASNTTYSRLYLSGSATIPLNPSGREGGIDTRNTVALNLGNNTGAGTMNHQSAPVLFEGAFSATESITVDIVSVTELRSNAASPVPRPGAIADFVTGGARPLFWWSGATIRPPLPGRVTLGRFYELENVTNASALSADYMLYKSTDISSGYRIDDQGLLQEGL